jgi:transposase-like protein
MLANPDASISSIAKLLGVSRTTIYKYVPELGAGHRPSVGGQARAALEQA